VRVMTIKLPYAKALCRRVYLRKGDCVCVCLGEKGRGGGVVLAHSLTACPPQSSIIIGVEALNGSGCPMCYLQFGRQYAHPWRMLCRPGSRLCRRCSFSRSCSKV